MRINVFKEVRGEDVVTEVLHASVPVVVLFDASELCPL